MGLRITKSLNWSDVNIIAKKSAVSSRSEVIVNPCFIVCSAMTSIIGPTFIKAVGKLPKEKQITLHIPRDIFKVENLQLCLQNNLKNIFVGVGLEEDQKYEEYAINLGYATAFIDIANGYLSNLIQPRVKQLRSKGFKTIICGSVHTKEGYQELVNCGVDIIRSGIAPGSVCETLKESGVTRGTFTEIDEMYSYKVEKGLVLNRILADGGIKTAGCCNKAFLAGANYIMSGRLFVEAFEARMHQVNAERFIPNHPENPYFEKGVYFGMTSRWGKIAMNKEIKHIEGREERITPAKSLEEIIDTLFDGIRSGIAYSGFSSLTECIGKGDFESKI